MPSRPQLVLTITTSITQTYIHRPRQALLTSRSYIISSVISFSLCGRQIQCGPPPPPLPPHLHCPQMQCFAGLGTSTPLTPDQTRHEKQTCRSFPPVFSVTCTCAHEGDTYRHEQHTLSNGLTCCQRSAQTCHAAQTFSPCPFWPCS